MIYAGPSRRVAERAGAPVDRGRGRHASAAQRHELAEPRSCSAGRRTRDIQVTDPNVSRRHAEVRLEGATYTLVDLDSTNGIEVDGKRVKQLELEDGTRFTLGSTEIDFSPGAAVMLPGLGAGRDDAARPQDRLPRPALPLHLAHRPLGRARPPRCRRSR